MQEQIINFGEFGLDLVNECLWHGTKRIHQPPRDFAVLCYLVKNPGRLVRKEELLQAVWTNTAVSEGVLKVTVRRIRRVLKDRPEAPRFIETQHRRGYWFIGPIHAADASGRQVRRPS